MSTVRAIESKIRRIEGFNVKFRDRTTGHDVKGNLGGLPGYPYERAEKSLLRH